MSAIGRRTLRSPGYPVANDVQHFVLQTIYRLLSDGYERERVIFWKCEMMRALAAVLIKTSATRVEAKPDFMTKQKT